MLPGFLTLDLMDLRVMQRASVEEHERVFAAKVIPIVQQKHQLLVTILLLDALAAEALPIFLDDLLPEWVNLILSATLVLVFGEMIPSAIATGPRQMQIAFALEPVVRFLLLAMHPIATPFVRMLDWIVHDGEEDEEDEAEAYNRDELTALLRIQQENRQPKPAIATVRRSAWASQLRPKFKPTPYNHRIKQWADLKAEIMERTRGFRSVDSVVGLADTDSVATEQMVPPLTNLEVEIVEGALSMKTKLVLDVYTPLTKLFSIPETTILSKRKITELYAEGYSRIPVYEPDPIDDQATTHILGFLMTRHLIMVNWDHNRSLSTLELYRPNCVSPRTNLVDLLRIKQSGGHIMTFVCARPDLATRAMDNGLAIPSEAGFMGIVTMEDIMESLIQDRIYDENDIRDRDQAVATLTRWAATKLQEFYRKKKIRSRSLERKAGRSSEMTPMITETTPLLGNSRQHVV